MANTINETTLYALILSNCSQHYPYAHTCFWNWKKGMNILVSSLSIIAFFLLLSFSLHFISFSVLFCFFLLLHFDAELWCIRYTTYTTGYCTYESVQSILLLCTAHRALTQARCILFICLYALPTSERMKNNEITKKWCSLSENRMDKKR